MSAHPSIQQAMQEIEATVPDAQADPTRPLYHFRPPAGYHNDPNGLIWHNGWYHMFYQSHPFTHGTGKGGPIFWGHARSRDLIRWDHLPFALWPSTDKGEQICASGGTLIRPDGRPMIFYTSVCERGDMRGAPDQWAAEGDDDLVVWRKHADNPVLTGAAHGDLRISEWRDPFVFRDGESYYMVIGGKAHRVKQALPCVTIYRAENRELTEWRFLNVLYEWPDPEITSLECPNLFRFGDKWLLFFSYHPPATQVGYVIGSLDFDTFVFHAEQQGTLEHSPMGMYAPQALRDENGRVILFGWVRAAGWYPDGGRGWSGCMTLPRVLSVRPDGELVQTPAAELRFLRGEHHAWQDLTLENAGHVLEGVRGDMLEIVVEFEPGNADTYGLVVRRSDHGQHGVDIRHDGNTLHVTGADPNGNFHGEPGPSAGADFHVPLQRLNGKRTMKFHVFLDKCVLELFVNDRACLTRAIYSPAQDLGMAVHATGGQAVVKRLDCWEMKPAW